MATTAFRVKEPALRVKEAAAELGVSPSSVYGLVRTGELPAYRVGLGRGTIRIEADDLDRVRKPAGPGGGGDGPEQLDHIRRKRR